MITNSILQRTLTPRQQASGLYLCEPDDHSVYIASEEGRILKRWFVSHDHPTIIEIQEAADRILEAREGIPFQVEDFLK